MRFLCAVGLLLSSIVPVAQARSDGAGDQDRARLIEGVQEIAAPGSPGSLAVFAPTANAVVTGSGDSLSEVAVIACGHLGRGRVAAFAHDGYFGAEAIQVADTSKILVNALRWAAGKPKPRVGLIDGAALRPLFEREGAIVERMAPNQRLQGIDVLVVTPARLNAEQTQRIRAFVRSGGGLLAAATGWGWRQIHNKPLTEFQGNALIAGSGLAWTDGFASPTAPKGFKVGGIISPCVNAAIALDLIRSGRVAESKKDMACALASIRQAIEITPDSEPQFRQDIRKMLNGLAKTDLTPTRRKPVRVNDSLRRLAVGIETVLAQSTPAGEVTPLTAASEFPGAIPAGAPRVDRTVTINTAVPGWQSLGLYAAPGEKVSVTVPKAALALNLDIQIGSHTDQLWDLDSWERIPQIVRRFAVTKTNTTATNALGGLIYIDVPERIAGPRGTISVTIKNAVEAPLYRLGVTTEEEWRMKQRDNPGPWAELAGKNVILTFPSSAIRKLDDPKTALTLWDQIVEAQDSFVSAPRRVKPERIVADVQISAGYMHSGYPIMIPTDDSVPLGLSEKRIRREGAWGYIHELGHNHQHSDWTFDGTGEVTNNLIVLYIHEKVLGLRFDSGHDNIRDRDKRNQRIREFMAKGAPFSEWKSDPFLALMMYIQIYEAFGSEPFQAVFAEYARLANAERPKSDDEKRDQWLTRLSKATGKNLGPFFQAWGIPTSDRARASVASLPTWMPEGLPTPRTR